MTENVRVGLYPSLMGSFNKLSPVLFMNSSSTLVEKEPYVLVIWSFKTNYLENPWILPSPSYLREHCLYLETTLPLSAVEISYQSI